MITTSVKTNEILHVGDDLVSKNGLWKATLKSDGNFVISGWKETWEAKTCGSDGYRLAVQTDGNVVLYDKCNTPKWSTNTYVNGANYKCRFELTDEGNLVLFKDDVLSWSSADS
ncbi:mannose-specific lectin-like [Xyrichtys novacula]|uniref:Mannose-specific lectin-like n=1 Tax=Xyrichtys novacula TaxID=13765 RepID=A0AAV1HBB3_XYRNO|nr:mannose-specific lectin-like [Xyrichtys novacula]